jgi:methylmalonyl-CoA mutase cobalamin-binding subunit
MIPGYTLRKKMLRYLSAWKAGRAPTRADMETAAEDILAWRIRERCAGLWGVPPKMVTATIDDGWGNGLKLIHLFAEAAGVQVVPLGLLQPPGDIAAACVTIEPAFLGMTVLQFDSEDDLIDIARNIPSGTQIVAGGPVFAADRELAVRAGIHYVAASAADFWIFLLDNASQSPSLAAD